LDSLQSSGQGGLKVSISYPCSLASLHGTLIENMNAMKLSTSGK